MTKKQKPTPTRWNRQKRVTYLQKQLTEAHRDIDSARSNNSWTAVASLRRQALGLRAELDDIKAAEAAAHIADHRLTDDQIVDEIRAAIGVLPVSVVEEIMIACEDRVGAPRLRVVDGE